MKNEEIRTEVRNTLTAGAGWAALILLVIFGNIILFYSVYHAGYDAGHKQGWIDSNDKTLQIVGKYNQVIVEHSNGTQVLLEPYHYCDPCVKRPAFCNTKIKFSEPIFTWGVMRERGLE